MVFQCRCLSLQDDIKQKQGENILSYKIMIEIKSQSFIISHLCSYYIDVFLLHSSVKERKKSQ